MKNNYFKDSYHWKDKKKLNRDSIYLRNLYEEQLKKISYKLNQFHDSNFSIRYWRIIVGPWLRFFIDIVFDRYEMERLSNKSFKIKLHPNHTSFSSPEEDFNDFYINSITDAWNDNLLKIIRGEIPNFQNSKIKTKKDIINILISNIINYFRKIFKKNILITDIYLPKIKYLSLFLKTGLLPLIPYKVKLKTDKDWNNFIKNSESKNYGSINNFETLIEPLIDIFIPLLYTDGFNFYKKYTLEYIGKIPRVIFTCIGYQHNEMFKIIAAETINNQGKLVISQHGGTFGIAKHNQMEEHQIEISDKFLSWGWNHNKNIKIKNSISFQLSGIKSIKANNNNKVINVMASTPRYFYAFFSLALGPEYRDYLNKQKYLLEDINKDISKNIFHRLNGDHYGWEATKRLRILGLKICPYKASLMNTLKEYSLCISSYNATVALQTLSMNYPTIIYWPKDIFEIRDEVKSDLEILSDFGIFHDNEVTFSNHLNKIYTNIPAWWNDPFLQKARHEFCLKYVNTQNNWIKTFWDELIV